MNYSIYLSLVLATAGHHTSGDAEVDTPDLSDVLQFALERIHTVVERLRQGNSRKLQSEVAIKGISAAVAERIASQPDRFPMELVGIAEAVCKELVSAQVVPVGVVAQKEK